MFNNVFVVFCCNGSRCSQKSNLVICLLRKYVSDYMNDNRDGLEKMGMKRSLSVGLILRF